VSEVAFPHLDLPAPPPLPADALRITPLGGLGAIGRNMSVLEFDG
jgi:ribonuclease J